MHHHRRPPLIQILAGRLLFASIFLISASVLVVFAFGYKVDFTNRQIQPTGVITIDGDLTDAQVFLDSHVYGTRLPISITNLTPNYTYRLSITKSGYTDWSKSVYVSSGFITAVPYVKLLPTKVLPTATDKIDKVSLCNRNIPSRDDALIIHAGELLTAKKLITRVSSVINDACWMGDANHVTYLIKRDIHITEADGTNDTKIYTAEEDVDEIAASSNGKSVYFHTLSDKWFEILLEAKS